MSDSQSQFSRNKLTLSDLENPSVSETKVKENGNYEAFSTVPKKPTREHLEQTRDQSFAGTKVQRHIDFSDPVQKYSEVLASIEEEIGKRPVFAPIKFQSFDFVINEDSRNKEKENNGTLFNTYGTEVKNKKSEKSYSKIEWKTEGKVQTGQLIRKLYGESVKDYGLEYRKKKFFENFKP